MISKIKEFKTIFKKEDKPHKPYVFHNDMSNRANRLSLILSFCLEDKDKK